MNTSGLGKQVSKNDREETQEALEIIYEMAQILNCGLDRQQLQIIVGMIENGVNPEALAHVVNEMRNEAAAYARVNNKS